MNRLMMIIVAVAVSAGCGTTAGTTKSSTTTTEPPPMGDELNYDEQLAPVVEESRSDLAAQLEVEGSLIDVASAELVTWSDGSLGCPRSGILYTEALVDGFRVVLLHDARFYDYHAGADEMPFLCASGAADGGYEDLPALIGGVPGERSPVTGEVPDEIFGPILDDASHRLAASHSDLRVIRAEAVIWNDGSLGCPIPGEVYTQALVNGYWVVISYDGEELDYRATSSGFWRLCESESMAPSG